MVGVTGVSARRKNLPSRDEAVDYTVLAVELLTRGSRICRVVNHVMRF